MKKCCFEALSWYSPHPNTSFPMQKPTFSIYSPNVLFLKDTYYNFKGISHTWHNHLKTSICNFKPTTAFYSPQIFSICFK